MRKIGYNFLLIFGLLITFGLATTVTANPNNDTKRPKNTGILAVKTSPVAYPVLVDGVQVGMSGVGQDALFYLTPGNHKVEILGPDGKTWSKEITTIKDRKECICLKMVEKEVRTPCPYNISVSGSEWVNEGDIVTFTATNTPGAGASSTNPLKYVWTISPAIAASKVTSGMGTDTITIDTTGLGKNTIIASVETTDGYYDATCRQVKTVSTEVRKEEQVKKRPFELLDVFAFRVFDDAKARLDEYVRSLQARQDGSGYIFFYQGTDAKAPNAEKISRRVLDYLVKVRGLDPSRVQIIQAGTKRQTTIELFVIYPGGEIPVPSPN